MKTSCSSVVLSALIASVSAISPAVKAENLLVNPGFEKVDPPGWAVFGDTAFDTEIRKSGEQSGKVWAWDYGDGVFEQYVHVTPGKKYKAGVYIWSKANDSIGDDTKAWIQIEWCTSANAVIGDPVKSPPLTASNSEWELLSTPDAVAPPEAAKAKVKAILQAPTDKIRGSCYFDDANFEAVP